MRKIRRGLVCMVVLATIFSCVGVAAPLEGTSSVHRELRDFWGEFYYKALSDSEVVYEVKNKKGENITEDFYEDTFSFYLNDDWDSISAYQFENVDTVVKIETRALDKTKTMMKNSSFNCYPISDVSAWEKLEPKIIFSGVVNYSYQASITYNVNTNQITSYTNPILVDYEFKNATNVSRPGTLMIKTMDRKNSLGYPKIVSGCIAQFKMDFSLEAFLYISQIAVDTVDYGTYGSSILQIDAQ